MIGAWRYEDGAKVYGDDVTYEKGVAWLDGRGDIEDWGCGCARAKAFAKMSHYTGIDGSPGWADKIVDLRTYRSDVGCVFMRHVLEHNFGWREILNNAVASFRARMVLVIFTPFSFTTKVIGISTTDTRVPVPDISFKREDLTGCFDGLDFCEESLKTKTQYGSEHVFYIEKR